MIDDLRRAAALVASCLEGFDPATVRCDDAAAVVEAAAEIVRRADALRLLAAPRAASGRAWRATGATSPAAWLAATSGTSTADAEGLLAAGSALTAAPEVEVALRSGALSSAQAVAVVPAAAADPGAAPSLLAMASTGRVEQLRRHAAKVVAAARPDDTADAQARVHASRYLRTSTDADGACCGRFRLTAEAGARLLAGLARHHEAVFAQVRAAGGRERADAVAADALVAMAEASSGGDGAGPRATIVARVDLAALERGRTVAGEESSIDGAGPVPVPVVRSMWAQAVLAVLVGDGDRVVDLRFAGRAMPARLRAAVVARDRGCVVPGCGATRHLEVHHWHTDVADGGDTYLDGLALVCPWHHQQITYRGAVLARQPVPRGAPGGWRYLPAAWGGPDDPDGGPFDDGYLDLHPDGVAPP